MAINYELINEKILPDVQSKMVEWVHTKSGAKVIAVLNEDSNKVFSITFRTPPNDNTGLPHILEHSVLCGSQKYPVKEPFVELVKGSLNTFLNAMTFSDKTMYPVASCNAQDFKNLMEVYMDAVFYPNIYKQPEIFLQEGWHYECDALDGPLTYNGVVYNEMKGAFSSAESVLYRKIEQELFPDTAYGFESGGDPDQIPQLTLEHFLDYHKKYYHPSNSYIYLYGNMDIEETLAYMDEAYLNAFDAIEVDSAIQIQQPFPQVKRFEDFYPIGEDESAVNKTYLSQNMVVCKAEDNLTATAFSVLEYLLLDIQGAPLKQALLDAGIGEDVYGSFDSRVLQPYLSIIVKNADETKEVLFQEVLTQTMQQIIKNGIDKEQIEAALNYFEFKVREADYGTYPKGLIYNLMVMDSWLYDLDPALALEYNSVFAFLREQIQTDYYEQLLEKVFFGNTHQVLVVLKPLQNMTAQKEELIKAQLAAYKASLTEQEVQQIIDQAVALKAYQEREDAKEDLEKLPLLSIEDIPAEAELPHYSVTLENGVQILKTHVFTNEIGYVTWSFDIKAIHRDELPYLSLLSGLLGKLNTKQRSYSELAKQINKYTGGLGVRLNIFTPVGDADQLKMRIEVKAKAFMVNQSHMIDLMKEVITETLFDDTTRIKELIAEQKARLQSAIPASGHSSAVSRVKSQFSKLAKAHEVTQGISYYQFIEKLDSGYADQSQAIRDRLESLFETVFNKKDMLIGLTGDPEDHSYLSEMSLNALENFESVDTIPSCDLKLVKKNEAFKTASKVQYVAKAGNYKAAGYTYNAQLEVLEGILSYTYLWNQVRVKGGAYGAMIQFNRNGDMTVVSYRDPNLEQTLTVYDQISGFIDSIELDERELMKNIIGTFSSIDKPLTPSLKGEKAMSMYLSGVSGDLLNQDRKEILATTVDSIREFAKWIKVCMDQNYICVIGNENKITESKQLFDEIKILVQ